MQNSWREIIDKYNKQTTVPISQNLKIIDEQRFKLYPHLEIFPSNENIFRAFSFCEIEDIKVVIIGQDPYHGPNQATGLCFAVNKGIKIPPSLRNIMKELKNDTGIDLFDTSLEHWAYQGVLLLNASLSVIQGQAASQMKLWSNFTDYIISELNKQDNIIFVAWGAFAHNKLKNIDTSKHSLIISSHPSPLSCHKQYKEYPAFKDSKPFLKINTLLKENNKTIEW